MMTMIMMMLMLMKKKKVETNEKRKQIKTKNNDKHVQFDKNLNNNNGASAIVYGNIHNSIFQAQTIKKNYCLPHCCKYATYIVILLIGIISSGAIIYYGVSLHHDYSYVNNYSYSSNCSNNTDITIINKILYNITNLEIEKQPPLTSHNSNQIILACIFISLFLYVFILFPLFILMKSLMQFVFYCCKYSKLKQAQNNKNINDEKLLLFFNS